MAKMALLLGLLLVTGFLTGVSALAPPMLTVTCDMDGVVVIVGSLEMSSQGYQAFYLQTDQDPQCVGSSDGGVHRLALSGAAFLRGKCGINFISHNGSITVHGNVHLVPESPDTIGIDVPISCTFLFNILGHVESSGTRPRATMSVFTDSAYISPQSRTLPLGKNVFVKVQLADANEKDIAVVLENCYATSSASPNDANRIPLLQNGTSVPGPLATEVIQNGNSNQGKFAFKMFKFSQEASDLYLHCDVYVCVQSRGHCHRERRRRRSAPNSHLNRYMTVSQGPLSYYED